MAIEKERVIARFKSLFGTIAMPTKRLDDISAKLALKMADDASDEDVDERLNDMNDVIPFLDIKKGEDRLANVEKKKTETKVEVEKEEDDDAPAWAKALLAKVEGLENAKKHETISEKFKKDERLKGIPEFMIQMATPKSEEEYEDKVESLSTNFKTFAEKAKLQNYGNDTPPNGSGESAGDVKKISKEDADKIVKGMNA